MARREFLTNDSGVKAICRYFGGEEHWRKCYNDIWKWKQSDPAFAEAYESYKKKMGKENAIGGRPKLDADSPTWREDYCAAYIKLRNPKEAASVTPYKFTTLMRKLDPDDSNRDDEFIRLFKLAQLELAADVEQHALDAAYTVADPLVDIETAKIMDIKSRIALNTLGKIHPARFGKKLEMNVTGRIDHKHSLAGRVNTLTSLMEEQRKLLLSKGKNLPMALPPAREEDQIIDVEFQEIREANAIS